MFTMMAMNEASDRPTFSSKSSSVSGTTIKQGGNKLMNKFFGNRTSPTKGNSIKEYSNEDETTPTEEFPPDLITPCPFIRPLEHKLEARSEPMVKPKHRTRSIETLSTTDSSAFAIAMNRQETHRILNNNILAVENDEDMAVDLSTMESITDMSTAGYQEHAENDVGLQISRQLEYVAVTSAADSQVVHHWGYYIQCYSKGQFNLNDPPDPPPRSSSFRYLPAVFPPQEETRMSVGRSFDIVWPHWSQRKANALISAAMMEFDSYFASLSFFDGSYEIFKAESGYKASRIPRSISIAAHALLSPDVLVVLDTKQDWRFEGNPLVCNEPKIRFFAGAPMLSSDGQPVGVFAIFGKDPRAAFSADQRRELANYSAIALKDLNQQAIYLSDPELRTPRNTPLLDRDSSINGSSRPSKSKSPPPVNIDHTLVPTGLRYHKFKTLPTNSPRAFLSRQLSPEVLSEQTPPSSSEGSENGKFPGSPRGFGKNHNQLSVNSDLGQASSYADMNTPNSEGFRVPTPRPFSASDLTSLNPHPPNTPVLASQDASLLTESDLTVENFMSLSDIDCAEQDSPLIDLSTPKDESKTSKTKERRGLEVPASSSRITMSSISTMTTGQSRESTDSLTEAAFSCSTFAQSLGYDLIYVVEIKPTRLFMTDNELFAPGGIQKRMLVAYGLNRPMELSGDMHVHVLRSRGFQAWENHRATYENGEYQSGLLIPIQTEGGPYRKRSSGLVFGAFRQPKPEISGFVPITAEESQKLLEAALALKEILVKKPNARRPPKRSNTEPASPHGHFANEAFEVRKHLLDETPERYPAGEAVAVRRRSPLSNNPALQERYPAGEAVEVRRRSQINNESAPQERYPASEAVEVGRFLREEITDRHPTKESFETGKRSLDSRKSNSAPPTPDRKLSKAKKVSQESKISQESKSSKTSKFAKASKTVEAGKKFSLDAGIDRPFHAVNRFRPF